MAGPPPGHVKAQITIRVYEHGALAVEGPIHDKAWCLAVLQNAIDAVNGHHRPRAGIVVPGHDVELPDQKGST